jgi:DNA-directed RNA polymerase specialized sigma24 family protein
VIALPSRASSWAEIFGLLSFFFAFVFSGGSKPPRPPGEPPEVSPRPPLPSTLPPPADPPQRPPTEPPRASEPPPAAPDEPPLDLRSVVALAGFYPVILHWLAVLRVPRDDRQDTAQEVVLSALRYWPSLLIRPGLSEAVGRRRWLFAVTVHRASDYRQHLRRMARVTWPALEGKLASEQPTAEELLLRRAEADEAAAEVDLEKLRAATSPERWAVFYAHDVEGLPMKVIAAAHGLPLGTVATHIRLAREDLRAAIRRARAQRIGEEQRARLMKK